jgi:hypothetical protein
MKTRNIKELLKIILRNVEIINGLQLYGGVGLCYVANELLHMNIFTLDEYCEVQAYITNNKPINPHTLIGKDNYYWKKGRTRPRIKWLKKHIKLN